MTRFDIKTPRILRKPKRKRHNYVLTLLDSGGVTHIKIKPFTDPTGKGENMTRKELIRIVAEKLERIRNTHKYSTSGMANKLGVTRSTYNRNIRGISLPDVFSLYCLGERLNISLDWLLREKGPMYFTEERPVKIVEKEVEKKEGKKEPPKPYVLPPIFQDLEDDLKELFEAMQRSSQLRYDILAYFLKLKKDQH